MIYKLTSIKPLIAKVYRDLNLQEESRWVDMIEWAAEALEHIGSYPQFKRKTEEVTIENHIGTLPCDFFKLEAVAFNNPISHSQLKPHSGSFDFNYDISDVADGINNSKVENGYTIDNCYIKTNFSEGTVTISYLAFYVDEDGFPMIPDDVSYREAIFRYIIMKLYFADYLTGKINPNIYRDMENEWHRYCMQARANANMPDLQQLESIKEMWVRLIPDIRQGGAFFKDLNYRERLRHK